MDNSKSSDKENFADLERQRMGDLGGREMLIWSGKKAPGFVEWYPAQEKEVYGGADRPDNDYNHIFWGDNKQVLYHLMKNYRDKVKLIYIDPPFDSKADYVKTIKLKNLILGKDVLDGIGDIKGTNKSAIEEMQYTDMWEKDEYLQFMYERLVIMKELLSDDGSIYLHCDHRRSAHLRLLMDEVFGEDNFRNEISWRRQVVRGMKTHAQYMPYNADFILFYGKTPNTTWNVIEKNNFISIEEADKKYMKDENGYFRTSDMGSYSDDSVVRLNKQNRIYVTEGGKLIIKDGKASTTRGKIHIKYYREIVGNKVKESSVFDNIWDDVPGMGIVSGQHLGYPTQKPEQLLERIIKASSNKGDLVMDCFAGSGTTMAVAERLGRKWIGCDINKGAILTSTHRLQNVIKESGGAFKVSNVNDYDVFKNEEDARQILLNVYKCNVMPRTYYFDGILHKDRVKVISPNRVLAKIDVDDLLKNIEQRIDEDFHPKKVSKGDESMFEEKVIVICSGVEPDVLDYLKKNNRTGVDVDVRDIQVDKKDFNLRKPSEAVIKYDVDGKECKVNVEDYYSPLLMKRLGMENGMRLNKKERVNKIDYRSVIEGIFVDWEYNEDNSDLATFNICNFFEKDKKEKIVDVEFSNKYEKAGEYNVAIKIVDVLGEEYFEKKTITIK